MTNPPPDLAVLLAGIREQTRFELQLLHERVNTLLAAEAFLTIAYTATMNSAGSWAAVVAPILAGLGLLLAALAWPGVNTTARLVMHWTYQIGNLEEQHPEVQSASPISWGLQDRRFREAGQRRSLLLFRFSPPTFLIVWVVLLVCSLVLRN